jgi:hypothetical protein
MRRTPQPYHAHIATVGARARGWHDDMMRSLLLATLLFAACAASHPAEHVAPPSAAGDTQGGEAVGAGGGGPEHVPEVVRAGKTFQLDYGAASARYSKGARCGGGDAPETVIGPPDQRNEMQQGHTRLVTYGYRFPQGTLLIRCRADHVEVQRTLK